MICFRFQSLNLNRNIKGAAAMSTMKNLDPYVNTQTADAVIQAVLTSWILVGLSSALAQLF